MIKQLEICEISVADKKWEFKWKKIGAREENKKPPFLNVLFSFSSIKNFMKGLISNLSRQQLIIYPVETICRISKWSKLELVEFWSGRNLKFEIWNAQILNWSNFEVVEFQIGLIADKSSSTRFFAHSVSRQYAAGHDFYWGKIEMFFIKNIEKME